MNPLFASSMNQADLKPLSKPCKDCAIKTGFYKPHADLLLQENEQIQKKVMNTWFCHNNCNRGCAGIREYIDKYNPKL